MDDPPRRMRWWTLRKGCRWRVGGVEFTPRETVTIEIDSSVPVERVKQAGRKGETAA